MAVPPRVVHKRRETITALPLYYSGHVQKKLSGEKDFRKYYAELRGVTLFLYKDDTQDTYTEKLDLEQLKSMMLDSPYKRNTASTFNLSLSKDTVQLKMDNPDKGEEWRCYILTVVKKEIPSKMQLLPGQILLLKEALAQEMRRMDPAIKPPLPPRPAFLNTPTTPDSAPPPADKPDDRSLEQLPCYFNVTRQEAEKMLEENPEYGGIILRPSKLANNFALTLRYVSARGPVKKNYRLTSTSSGIVINLDTPVTVSSLSDVLEYFLEKVGYRVHPYVPSQPYSTCIEMEPVPKCISITSPTAKNIPKAQVAPMVKWSQAKEEGVHSPAKQEESEYVVPEDQNLQQGELDGDQVLHLKSETVYTDMDKQSQTTAPKSEATGETPA